MENVALLPVDVWSDFVCPWCFLASTSLKRLEESHPVDITWHAYELRPAGSPPMPEAYKARIESMQPQLKAMAKEQYDITLNSGPFGISSRAAHIGMKYAEMQGRGEAYHAAVFKAYWQQAQDISHLDVLAAIAVDVGLDRDGFLASLDQVNLDQQVNADISQAQAFNISGVPAMVFDGKYLIPGAQPYDELARITDYVKSQET
jgi:predicted DsbA family dithiol-disulfide isomerase